MILAILGLFASGLKQSQAGSGDRRVAPGFTLTDFDGHVTTVGDLRGQVVIINFWAS